MKLLFKNYYQLQPNKYVWQFSPENMINLGGCEANPEILKSEKNGVIAESKRDMDTLKTQLFDTNTSFLKSIQSNNNSEQLTPKQPETQKTKRTELFSSTSPTKSEREELFTESKNQTKIDTQITKRTELFHTQSLGKDNETESKNIIEIRSTQEALETINKFMLTITNDRLKNVLKNSVNKITNIDNITKEQEEKLLAITNIIPIISPMVEKQEGESKKQHQKRIEKAIKTVTETIKNFNSIKIPDDKSSKKYQEFKIFFAKEALYKGAEEGIAKKYTEYKLNKGPLNFSEWHQLQIDIGEITETPIEKNIRKFQGFLRKFAGLFAGILKGFGKNHKLLESIQPKYLVELEKELEEKENEEKQIEKWENESPNQLEKAYNSYGSVYPFLKPTIKNNVVIGSKKIGPKEFQDFNALMKNSNTQIFTTFIRKKDSIATEDFKIHDFGKFQEISQTINHPYVTVNDYEIQSGINSLSISIDDPKGERIDKNGLEISFTITSSNDVDEVIENITQELENKSPHYKEKITNENKPLVEKPAEKKPNETNNNEKKQLTDDLSKNPDWIIFKDLCKDLNFNGKDIPRISYKDKENRLKFIEAIERSIEEQNQTSNINKDSINIFMKSLRKKKYIDKDKNIDYGAGEWFFSGKDLTQEINDFIKNFDWNTKNK